MRKHFLVLALGSLFGLAWCADAEAQNNSFGTNGNLWASVGWSYMDLPDVKMLTRVGPLVPGVPQSRDLEQTYTDHDGDMDNGWRVDAGARLFGFPMNGSQAAVGVKGFYAKFEDTQSARCESVGGGGCSFFPLFDFDPNSINAIFFGNDPGLISTTRTSRDVDHWGAALEMASVGPMDGTAWAPRIGLAIKAIDQDLQLNFRTFPDPPSNPQTAKYNEDLETYYYGVYVGGETWCALGGGFSLGLDGEIGVYYARSDYDGTLNANGALGTNVYTQKLSLDNDEAAVIGSLKVELKNTVDMAEFSVFAMADYYSYAPEMAYNQLDIDNTLPFEFAKGGNTRTTIDDGDMWSATIGGKVTVRLN